MNTRAFIALAIITLGTGCADDPAEGTDGASGASCSGVLLTEQLSDASSDLTLQLDGEAIPIGLVADAAYPANPVWDAGAAPAACGVITAEGNAIAILQLERDGAPVLRFQVAGAPPGQHDLASDNQLSLLAAPSGKINHNGEIYSFVASQGTMTITPDPLLQGELVTIDVDLPGGEAINDATSDIVSMQLQGSVRFTGP